MLNLDLYDLHELGLDLYKPRVSAIHAVQMTEPFIITQDDCEYKGNVGDYLVVDSVARISVCSEDMFHRLYEIQ